MTEAWTNARRPRAALQTRLVGDQYTKIVTPRTSARIPLKDVSNKRQGLKMASSGHEKKSASIIRKRGYAHLSVNEVKDSQAESDEENQPVLRLNSDTTRSSDMDSSPVKRRKICTKALSAPTCDTTVMAKPTTPRVSRFIEHDSSSPEQEIPSSVLWERHAFLPWCQESPIKVQKYKLLPLPLGMHSPPLSSPAVLEQSRVQVVQPLQNHQITPIGHNVRYADTPPPTIEGTKLFQEYTRPAIAIHDDAEIMSDPFEADSQAETIRRRIPLTELDPSLILAPKSRQPLHTPPATVTRLEMTRETTTASRDESPIEWYDALESLSQPVPSSPVQAMSQAEIELPPVLRQSTVQDSQFDETFAPLSSSPSLPSLPSQGHPTSDASDRSDWQNANSLAHTLLPPHYRSSQFRSDVVGPMSDAWQTDLSSTQDQSPRVEKRSCPASEGDPLPRKRVALPSSEPCSFDYDESLANTMLPPPLFSVPCPPED